MVQQKWLGLPQISRDAIEPIAQWEVDDLAEVTKGGSQAMQQEILAGLHNLLEQRPVETIEQAKAPGVGVIRCQWIKLL